MRNFRYVFVLIVVVLVATGLLTTLGLLGSGSVFYLTALWLVVLLAVGMLLSLGWGYQRIVIRVGTANERLIELRFLQERRYEQLRQRMDYLSDSFRVLHRNMQHLEDASDKFRAAQGRSSDIVELENINARLQRTERRILGKLENDCHGNESVEQQFVELLESLRSNTELLSENDRKNTRLND